MSDDSSIIPASVPANSRFNPVRVFFALANEARWAIVGMLAGGREMTASEVAAALGRDVDGVAKQLRVMRDCGVLDWRDGEDRRQTFYFIAAELRRTPGVLDFGFCTVQMPSARPPVVKD